MNLCITINLQKKFIREESLNIIYFEENKFSNMNINKLKDIIDSNKIRNILIEEKTIDNIHKFNALIKYTTNKNIKVLVLYYGRPVAFYNDIFFVDLQKNNYLKYIKKVYSFKNTKPKNSTNLSNVENGSINRQFQGGDNVIIVLSLDRKLYTTTYMYLLALKLIDKFEYDITFFEKDQSIIDFNILFDLNKKKFSYEKYSIIDEVEIKENGLFLIDIGCVSNYVDLQSILKYEYKKIIVFTTDCIRVNETNEYIKMIRLLEKYNQIYFVNRKDIFDKKIQENLKNINSKVVKKNINKLIKEFDD